MNKVEFVRTEVLEHYATKSDLAQMETRLTKDTASQFRWIVGLLAGVIVTALTSGATLFMGLANLLTK